MRWLFLFIPGAVAEVTLEHRQDQPDESDHHGFNQHSCSSVLPSSASCFPYPGVRSVDLLLESIIDLFYPLADMVLLILALRILFSANKGSFSQSWLWISLGFIVISFSDLFFTYSSVRDLVLP